MNRAEDIGSGHTHASDEHAGGGCCGGRGHSHAHEHAAPQGEASSGGCCGGSGSQGGGCCGGASAGADQIHVFSRKQIRDLDRLAVEEFGMPSILLMENAARGIAGVILEGLQGVQDPPVLIVCGPGNNGGDGLAVARHLANRGVKVAVVLGAPEAKYSGDALTNLRIVQKMDVPVFEASREGAAEGVLMAATALIGEPVVVVDALLGTGLDRPATGVMAELIERMNGLKTKGATLVAIDVPSGLDCDTGQAGTDATGTGPVVEADLTIALAGIKAGFMTSTAQRFVGELVVVEIGVPRELVARLGRPLTAPSHA